MEINWTDIVAILLTVWCVGMTVIDSIKHKCSVGEINDRSIIRTGLSAVCFAVLIIIQSRDGVTPAKVTGLVIVCLYCGMVLRRLTR